MNRGRSASPRRVAPSRSRSHDATTMSRQRTGSMGPGDRARSRSPSRAMSRSASMSRSRSMSRGPGRSTSPSGRPSMKGRRPLRGVRKYGTAGVRKFQNTRIGKRIAPEEKCSPFKFCSYVFALLLLLISSVGLAIATGKVDLDNLIPIFDPAAQEDPFSGDNTPTWDNGGSGGLDMEVLNALDDDWQTMFQVAYYDWQYGDPNALTLTTTRVPYDFACKPVDGKVKVCNGNYGVTQWRGIATADIGKDGYMKNVVAKMNDHFLKYADDDLRQYTMCHELGHCVGLGHDDEDFYNEDTGSCMDYTMNYNQNKRPSEGNFIQLTDFYGFVGRRQLRGKETKSNKSFTVEPMPEEVKRRREHALEKLEELGYQNLHLDGWRMLHQAEHSELHELDLGEGYKLSIHMLLA